MDLKISIVMPVFNGERYLIETLESLFIQSFKEWELICINDASSDKSLDILKDYSKKMDIKIINLEHNIGKVPFLIKTFGLPNINGQYFMYMSQDDFLSPDCLENLYSTALKLNADAVIPDFEFYKVEGIGKKIIGVNGKHDIVLNGNEAFVLSLDWKIPGAALWRSDLVKRLGYEDFNMYADEYTVRKYFLECKKVAFCTGIFYYRVDNPNAITKKMKPALFSKVYKESKLLELVYLNSELQVFYERMEKLIIMFYDYHQELFYQKFNSIDKAAAKDNLKVAFLYFNMFINNNNIAFRGHSKTIIFKYYLIRSNYFLFYLFCRIKYLIRH